MCPILSQYNHIHKAMGGELLKVEEQAAALDPNNPESVAALVGHLGMIRAILDVHAHAEEDGAWPMIEAKFPGLTRPYLLDHDYERSLFASIDTELANLQQPTGDKAAAGKRLYHMSKEEAHPLHDLHRIAEQRRGAADYRRRARQSAV